ncbi:unnamed protein product [Rhodiola kirilowii]
MTSAVMEEEEDEEEEVFFEAVDSISEPAESDEVNENLVYEKSEYEIWMSEPQSVQERRNMFIHGMRMAKSSPCTDADLKCISKGSDEDELSSDALDDTFGLNNPSSCSSQLGTEDEVILCSNRFEQDEYDEASTSSSQRVSQPLSFMLEHECKDADTNIHSTEHNRHSTAKKKRSWLELLLAKNAKKGSKPKPSQMKVSPENKKCIEFSAVYAGQKIKAHSGCIRIMKISPDGQYLASGGEDGVIRIWLISSADGGDLRPGKLNDGGIKSLSAPVVIPDKRFHITEFPLHEFCGHSGCVVDLAWSKSNYIVSSSKDGTVRLWQIGMDDCLNVFHHSDPVTCVHFNPVDDDYFISGSIDGKVRIWGTFKGRVTDWIDVRDVITAICYQPDGTGVVVGSSTGICRFYGYPGDDPHLQLEAQVHIHGKKKTLSNKITSIQFSPDEIQRMMITSDDSVVRILDGVNIVHKYKGLRKSRRQLSATFTPTGQHIISLDADSRIYVWNYDGTPSPSFKKSSTRSCEHFLFKDVSVAIPWAPMQTDQTSPFSSKSGHLLNPIHQPLGSWLPIDVPFGGSSTTWPEDLLPCPDWDVPIAQSPSVSRYHSFPMHRGRHSTTVSDTWGLVIVTASRDGLIRTLHNYGLPTRTRSRQLVWQMAQ